MAELPWQMFGLWFGAGLLGGFAIFEIMDRIKWAAYRAAYRWVHREDNDDRLSVDLAQSSVQFARERSGEPKVTRAEIEAAAEQIALILVPWTDAWKPNVCWPQHYTEAEKTKARNAAIAALEAAHKASGRTERQREKRSSTQKDKS